MAAAWNKHAAIITLLAFLAPMACHGGGGGLITFTILCKGGWVSPQTISLSLPPFLTITIGCSDGSSGTPIPPYPAPSPSPPAPTPPPPPSGASQLYPDYYNSVYSNYACPNAEAIVKKIVEQAIASQGSGIGAGLVRLHFHDCFVDGCDGSVLLNKTASGNSDTEREGLPNKNSLRGFEVVDQIKTALEDACPGAVSCADILAFAAREAARILSSGKINYAVPAGRWDGRESFANRTGTLPGPFSPIDTLKAKFADQGLKDPKDLAALSGAHSFGRARCIFISKRPGMNQTLVSDLNQKCNSSPTVNQDYKTPDELDSQYYQNVFDNDALFDSDAALTNASDTNALVETYRTNSMNVWEKDFGDAMVKMGEIKVKTKGDMGAEIRKQCWTYNAPAPAPAPSPSN